MAIGPEIRNGVHGASKAFMLALTPSLHHELGTKGVRVLPGLRMADFESGFSSPAQMRHVA